MLCTYNQTFSAEKNQVGRNFLRPKNTAKSRRGSSEHIEPIYRIVSAIKPCYEIFPGDVENSAKQKKINQTFDHFCRV